MSKRTDLSKRHLYLGELDLVKRQIRAAAFTLMLLIPPLAMIPIESAQPPFQDCVFSGVAAITSVFFFYGVILILLLTIAH
jgi:hypothetical protein